MPKGYIIGRISVHDPLAYKAYAQAATEAQARYGAKVLVRGGKAEALEGEARARNVVLEFDSPEAARTYYESPEYQRAIPLHQAASTGELVLVEGV